MTWGEGHQATSWRVGWALLCALLVGLAVRAVAGSPARAQPASGHAVAVTEADLLARPSLEVLVQYAIEHNPGIRAARFEWEAVKERITSQSWYENPVVTYMPDTGAMAETRAGPQANGVEVSQAIPFLGKLTLRGRVEEARAGATYQILEATIQETSRQVRARYADSFLAARLLDINEELTDLTRQVADVAQAKYRVGTAAQQDVILAHEQLSRLAIERVVFQGNAETGRHLRRGLFRLARRHRRRRLRRRRKRTVATRTVPFMVIVHRPAFGCGLEGADGVQLRAGIWDWRTLVCRLRARRNDHDGSVKEPCDST